MPAPANSSAGTIRRSRCPPTSSTPGAAAGKASAGKRAEWQKRLAAADPKLRAEFERRISGELPANFDATIADYKKKLAADKPKVATRKSSEMALEVINGVVPETIGGSADLTGSNNTKTSQTKAIAAGSYGNRYVHYGIREHGMAAAMSGLTLHGGIIPYGGTFLCFSDYARPAMRLASLMGIRSIYVMTHDSIGLGEDGPTHQPVEHLAALRAIPNHLVFRPADATEAAECWQLALESTEDAVDARADPPEPAGGAHRIRRGKPVRATAPTSSPRRAAKPRSRSSPPARKWRSRSPHARCSKATGIRPASFRCRASSCSKSRATTTSAAILGKAPVKVAIEAGIRQGWDSFIGTDGIFIGMTGFGASGTIEQLYPHFGITAEAAAKAAEARLHK